jgi:hypothetical protein
MYSTTPTNATASPPKECESAIRSGILVMGIHMPMGIPMSVPRMRPVRIHSKRTISGRSKVPATAMIIPTTAIVVPRRAVVGLVSPRRPKTKSNEATR